MHTPQHVLDDAIQYYNDGAVAQDDAGRTAQKANLIGLMVPGAAVFGTQPHEIPQGYDQIRSQLDADWRARHAEAFATNRSHDVRVMGNHATSITKLTYTDRNGVAHPNSEASAVLVRGTQGWRIATARLTVA